MYVLAQNLEVDPMKIWKPAKSVNKRTTAAGTVRYCVAYAWKKLGSKTRQWKSFDTQEEAEKYRVAHNAKLEARTHSACSAFDEATSHEIALWKHRLAVDKGITIPQALKYSYDKMSPSKGSTTLKKAVIDYYKTRDFSKLAKDYVYRLKQCLDLLTDQYGSTQVNELKMEELKDWLDSQSWAPSTRKPHESSLRMFFTWCFNEEYTTQNPTNRLQLTKIIKDDVRIMSPFVVGDLLNLAAEKGYWRILFSRVITFFIGFRRSETAKFSWGDFRWHTNDLVSLMSHNKGRTSRRVNKIPPNARQWLLLCKANKVELPLKITTLTTEWNRLLAAYKKQNPGFDYKQNTCRHCFTGYDLAMHNSASATAKRMGNTEKIVLNTYNEIATKKDAEIYWAIEPDKKFSAAIDEAKNQLPFVSTLKVEDIPGALKQYEQFLEAGKLDLARQVHHELVHWRHPETGESAFGFFNWHPSNPEVTTTKDGTQYKLSK
jgi:integrase